MVLLIAYRIPAARWYHWWIELPIIAARWLESKVYRQGDWDGLSIIPKPPRR